MKNEILERMNEKRNHLHSFALFPAFSQFSGIFPSERAKTYSSTARTLLKIDSVKRAAHGHFVASGRALFSSRIFQLCANYYIVSRLLIEMNLDGTVEVTDF